MTRFAGLVVVVCTLLSAQETSRTHSRPRIGLVLEGGGALGFAHIGVLQYLEEHHIPVDIIAGTSMGGLVGGLYAIGESPAEIRELTGDINWDAVMSGVTDFQDLSFRRKEDKAAFPNRLELGLKRGISLPLGLNAGHQVGLVFSRTTLAYPQNMNFNDLPIPFRCVATDITTGRMKVFDRGSLAQALRATMSIPAVFSPVTIDGHLYTDGGAVDNLPVDVAKQAGAQIIIAVYLDTGPPDPKAYDSLLTVATKNISIMISVNELRNMKEADILLNADVRGFTSSSFNDGADIIPKGYAAASQKQQMLAGLAVDQEAWSAYIAHRASKELHTIPVPQFVQVVGDKTDYANTLLHNLQPYIGKPISTPELEKTLTHITGTGVIDTATYTMVEKQGTPGLQVTMHDKPFAPPFLDLGVTIDGSNPDYVLFGMAARLTFKDLGGYRAEWRNDAFFGSQYGVHSEYYKPFTGISKWFYAPHIYALSSPFNLFAGEDRTDQYRLERDGFGLDVGYALNRRSELRIGQDLFWFKTVKKVTTDPIPNTTDRETYSHVGYRYFGTDNIEVPREGHNIEATYGYYGRESGLTSFSQASLRTAFFKRVSDPGSIFLIASGGTSFNAPTDEILFQAFSLGGPLRLGAYGQNELLGSKYYLFQTGYEHKLLSFSPLLGEGLYGISLFEVGKIYDPFNFGIFTPTTVALDGTIALIARTSLGPVFFGASFGKDNHNKWWFGLGRVF
jgi:NTE family protein